MAANATPVAYIDSISPNPATPGQTISFSGHGTDSDGTITGYNWRSNKDGTLSTSASFSKSNLSTGTHTIYFKVRDNYGTWVPIWSPEVSKTLTIAAPNQAPALNTVGDQTISEGSTLSFTVSATDPDGNPLTYTAGNLPPGAAFNPALRTFIWTPDYTQTGTYTGVSFTVSDGTLSDSETITITVEEAGMELPSLIRFHGTLGDDQGEALDGSYSLTFRLYSSENASEAAWEETHPDVVVDNGEVDVELGSITKLGIPFDKQYWLGVEVGSDGEMTPRFKLTTVPYSFRAKQR